MERTATRLTSAALALALALVVAGCSGGGGGREPVDTPAVRVVTLNVLHGLFCAPDTDWCRAPARLALLWQHLEAAGCPDLVGLQEVGPRQEELIAAELPRLCEGAYRLSWGVRPGPDRGMILSRLPVIEEGFLDIAGFPWEANWVRVRAPGGTTVDFLTTHFASSANNPPCDASNCPPVCATGIETNECHAREVVDLFAPRRPPATLSIVAGDLNATPGSPTIDALHRAGFVDAWTTGGRPECSRAEPDGCTGGGEEPGTPLIGMDTVDGLAHDARIDWVMVRARDGCALQAASRAFAGEPAVTPVAGMYWASDHAGVLADLTCAR